MTCELIRPGHSRLVGRPRAGGLAYGLALGGPWDARSAAFARALAGMEEERGDVLEVGPLPFALRATCSLLVGMAGAPRTLRVRRCGHPELRYIGYPADMRAVPLDACDELWLGESTAGMHTYLCIRAVPAPSGRCGLASSSIASADALRGCVGCVAVAGPVCLDDGARRDAHTVRLRVVEGPEWPRGVREDGLQFLVGPDLNRQGVRLAVASTQAQVAAARMPTAVPSSPTIAGLIQWPRGGDPVILGPDCQTVGGYPRLAVVVSADVRRIGCLRPGDIVSLERVTLQQAAELWLREQQLTGRVAQLFRAVVQSWYHAG